MIQRGERTQIGQVHFLGTPGHFEEGPRTRPRTVIPGLWTRRQAFSVAALQSDLVRLRSLLLSRGYFDAKVRLDSVDDMDNRALVAFHVDAGERYLVRQVEMVDVENSSQLAPGATDLCGCRFDLRRKAQNEGRLDFTVNGSIGTGVSAGSPAWTGWACSSR